jgi:hypothetical protein
VKGFLKSTHDTLEENEEIHVIHKTTYPYKKWEIEKSAEDAGLFLVKKVNFRVSDYPGYENKIGQALVLMRLLLLGTVVSSNLPGLQLLDIINHAPKA